MGRKEVHGGTPDVAITRLLREHQVSLSSDGGRLSRR